MKIIRWLCFAFGAGLALLYLLPYFFSGIFNIGTIFGLCMCGVICFVSLFWNTLKKLSGKIKQRRLLKYFYYMFTACALALFFAFVGTFAYVLSGTIPNADGQNTVVVLGCAVHGDRPSRQLRQRINKAYEYLSKNPEAVAVLSGGKGETERISEAQCMKNCLVELGIDENRLYTEEKSTTTEENLEFSKAIMIENNISFDAVIVTSDYHERRALLIAKDKGFSPHSFCAYSDPSPVFYTRDILGIWHYLFFKNH